MELLEEEKNNNQSDTWLAWLLNNQSMNQIRTNQPIQMTVVLLASFGSYSTYLTRSLAHPATSSDHIKKQTNSHVELIYINIDY